MRNIQIEAFNELNSAGKLGWREHKMAGKKEFTSQDMKQAFQAGAKVSDSTSWAWQRWMRSHYPGRYVRRAATVKSKADRAGKD